MVFDSAITTEGLTRRFGAVTAVDGLSLNVPRGSIYGFLGPNGAGKTTTIRMLLGLIRPDTGEVRILGDKLRGNEGRLLRCVGALVEAPSIYPNLTGRENLEVTRRLTGGRGARIDRVLALVKLENAAGRRVAGYSTGMKQRLGLALALLNEPELLILDEPTNGLDPAGMQEMRDLLRGLTQELSQQRETTIFLSSHLLAEVEHVASHIGIIHEGTLRFQGAMEDLQAQVEQRVVLGVTQPRQAAALLQGAGWKVIGNGAEKLVVPANGRSDAARINTLLEQNGLTVYHLDLQRPTLEDMFMTLTGASGTEPSDHRKTMSTRSDRGGNWHGYLKGA